MIASGTDAAIATIAAAAPVALLVRVFTVGSSARHSLGMLGAGASQCKVKISGNSWCRGADLRFTYICAQRGCTDAETRCEVEREVVIALQIAQFPAPAAAMAAPSWCDAKTQPNTTGRLHRSSCGHNTIVGGTVGAPVEAVEDDEHPGARFGVGRQQ